FVIEGIHKDIIVSLDLVPHLPNAQLALIKCILHQEAHWLVLESVIDPVLKLVCCLGARGQSKVPHTCIFPV
ncbi:MAG: hypothetical protein ACKPKO_18660, partial [Candidatus Fonsibacter sp.]